MKIGELSEGETGEEICDWLWEICKNMVITEKHGPMNSHDVVVLEYLAGSCVRNIFCLLDVSWSVGQCARR